jgi:NTE family protein
MKPFTKETKIGLALGGGGVLGAAHIGVLKALQEQDLTVNFIAGTSIGAFVSALYAFGKSWQDIHKIALHLDWLDTADLQLAECGLLSNGKIGNLIQEELGEARFEQSQIPLAMVATNISNGNKVIIQEGSLPTAVRASTCIPGLYAPVERQGELLVDGGIVENVPISPLQNVGADVLIGVSLDAKFAPERPNNIIEVVLRSFYYAIEANTRMQAQAADILIKPDLSSFNLIDTDQTEDLLQKGYEETQHILKKHLS